METKLTHQIVICVHQGSTNLELCLKSLYANLVQDESIIIIYEKGLSEEKLKLIRNFSYLSEKITIIPYDGFLEVEHINNRSIEIATADIVTLLSSNTIVSQGWSKKILEKFERWNHLSAVGPLSNSASHQSVPGISDIAIHPTFDTLPENVSIQAMNAFCEEQSKTQAIPFVPTLDGFCLSLKRKAVLEIDGFDEINFPFIYCSVEDLILRLKEAGYTAAISTDTYIYHSPSHLSQSKKHRSQLLTGLEDLYRKHGKAKIEANCKYMRDHPSLVAMRAAVHAKFYSHDFIPLESNQTHIAALPAQNQERSHHSVRENLYETQKLVHSSSPEECSIVYQVFSSLEAMYHPRWIWNAVLTQVSSLTLKQAKRLRRLCDQYRTHLIFEIDESHLLSLGSDHGQRSTDPQTQVTRYLFAAADCIIIANSDFSYDFNILNKISKRVEITLQDRLSEVLHTHDRAASSFDGTAYHSERPRSFISEAIKNDFDKAILECASPNAPLFQFP